ncbi:MAG: glycosyltransferase [Flammeovirgaceae bacterium]
MKVLIVGADTSYGIENCYVKYLRSLGVDVSLFSAQNIFYEYYNRNLLNKVLFKSGLSAIYDKINQAFCKCVSSDKPDIVWVFKGMEIDPKSLQWVRNQGIKLVNYNPDNPFIFSGRGSGNSNVTNSIGLYDFHFTYDAEIKNRIELEFHLPVQILPFGSDVSSDIVEECFTLDEINKACFLGNADEYRVNFLNELSKQNIEIDIFGHYWNRFFINNNIKIYHPAYSNEFWKTLWKYRVQINLMRPHNPNSHNMRSFEVPSVGGILLAPYTKDHASYFEPNSEIFLYSDLMECANQINKLLKLTADDALKIRHSARSRYLKSGYSYQERAQQVYSVFKSITNNV